MTGAPHIPVLLAQVVEVLSPRDGGVYLDGTFGAGGYARALLDAADCVVIGMDRDGTAISGGKAMAESYGGRLILLRGRFSDMEQALADMNIERVDGIALDLGVSSMQLDRAERGFSFGKDGPLDMRMEGADTDGLSAADVVNDFSEADLARIIAVYGEEKRARAVARAIVAARGEEEFSRTGQLSRLVEGVLGRSKPGAIHAATRTFQGLRIYVNDELGELARGLFAAERTLKPTGRLAVVSFHSLEDRIVKRFLQARAGKAGGASRHRPEQKMPEPSFRLIGRGLVRPDAEEERANPRARSARLRAAERTHAAPWPQDTKSLGLVSLELSGGGRS